MDGSSTVAPLTTAAAELFKEEQAGVNVTVGTSGTGGGFEKFCAGETDISDASRPIKDDEEAPICAEKGIEYVEIPVANDALTVVVSTENDWVDCLTTEQLKAIWEPGSKVNSWKDVDPSFPDEKLELFGPGTDSGTFDYFTDEINGEEGASRDGLLAVRGRQRHRPGRRRAARVASGTSASPTSRRTATASRRWRSTAATVASRRASRPPRTAATRRCPGRCSSTRPRRALEKPQVKAFVDFYVENDAEIAEAAQFIPLSDEQKTDAASRVYERLRRADDGIRPPRRRP